MALVQSIGTFWIFFTMFFRKTLWTGTIFHIDSIRIERSIGTMNHVFAYMVKQNLLANWGRISALTILSICQESWVYCCIWNQKIVCIWQSSFLKFHDIHWSCNFSKTYILHNIIHNLFEFHIEYIMGDDVWPTFWFLTREQLICNLSPVWIACYCHEDVMFSIIFYYC